MKKKDLFIRAMKADEYRRTQWVISAFCLIREDPEAWRKSPTPFKIVQTQTAYFYVDPDKQNELMKIDDALPGKPIYGFDEIVTITEEDIPNLKGTAITTYGILLANYTLLVYPFNDKIPYINDEISISSIENIILPVFVDNPLEEGRVGDKEIPVSEYLKFVNAAQYLEGFAQICVPAATPKSILPAPGIHEFRDKLIKENQNNLHDPTVIARIDKQLKEYDKEYLKGDLSNGHMLEEKSYDSRKKMYAMYGAEQGLEEKVTVDPIIKSLSEGWDIDYFPQMNNALRAGSYFRGAQTQLGGEAVKWLLRASSNIRVTVDDCGSKLGMNIDIDDSSYESLVGFTLLVGGKTLKITDKDMASKYIGKSVEIRSPMFCNLTKTDYCKTCVGDKLSLHPNALSAAISEYGSIMLNIFMKLMHGKALTLARVNLKQTIF